MDPTVGSRLASFLPTALAVGIALWLAAAGLWDVLVWTHAIPGDTVSAVIQSWIASAPQLALAVGVLLGHLFFPVGPRGPTPPPGGILP